MRVYKKQTDASTCRLTFEFNVNEIPPAMLPLFRATWNSKRADDYLRFLQMLRADQAQETLRKKYADILRGMNGSGQAAGGTSSQYDFARHQMGFEPKKEPFWCRILGVSPDATKSEIKTKYRELAKIHHPDAGGDPDKFREISNAYEEAIKDV